MCVILAPDSPLHLTVKHKLSFARIPVLVEPGKSLNLTEVQIDSPSS